MQKYSFVNFVFIIVALLLITSSLKAQYSPYTRYGLGELSTNGFGQNIAMGGSGIALRLTEGTSDINPASLTAIPLNAFFFDVGTYGKLKETASANESARNTFANISYGAIGFSFTKWLSTGVGLRPYSNVGYSISDYEDFGDYTYENIYSGIGGITRFYWSNAVEIHKTLSVGAKVSYLFGPVNYDIQTRYSEIGYNDDNEKITTYQSISDINNKAFFKDMVLSYGLQFSPTISKRFKVGIGATYENPQGLNAKVNRLVTNTKRYNLNSDNIENTVMDTVVNDMLANDKIVLPEKIGLGVAFYIDSIFGNSDKLVLTGDYQLENWADATFFGNETNVLSNSRTISGGFQYVPAILAKRYWHVIRYRGGFRYNESYLQFNGSPLIEKAITFGVGLPMVKVRSLVNIGVELGTFGTTDNMLIREKYAKLHINLALGDMWFVKRKFD